jgi:hypothetical protein
MVILWARKMNFPYKKVTTLSTKQYNCLLNQYPPTILKKEYVPSGIHPPDDN